MTHCNSLEQRLQGEFSGRLQTLEEVFEDKLLLQQHLRQGEDIADGFVELFEFLRQVEHEPLLQGQVEVRLVLGGLLLADMVDVVEDGTADVDLLDAVREFLELELLL